MIFILVQGGVDFSQATRTEDGRLCVIKVVQIIISNVHKSTVSIEL